MNKILTGALAGLITAASIDFQAFKAWKSLNDARSYDWGIALFRWAQGAIIGALTATGVPV